MAKFSNPLGGNREVFISQTLHGSANTAIDIGSVTAGKAVYAIADGKVLGASSSSGSYCYQSVEGSDIQVWYVHTYNWLKKGTLVKKGQKICEIAPKSQNGGFAIHLHLGLTPKGTNIMEYFDRTIPFRTKYADIKASWFKSDGTLNWSKFKDLSYSNDDMSNITIGKYYEFNNTSKLNIRNAPNGEVIDQLKENKKCVGRALTEGVSKDGHIWNMYAGIGWGGYIAQGWNTQTSRDLTDIDGEQNGCDELKDQVSNLKSKVGDLESELTEHQEENDTLRNALGDSEDQIENLQAELEELNITWDKKYNQLRTENLRLSREKGECQKELDALKNSRFIWIVEWLNKIIPKKDV